MVSGVSFGDWSQWRDLEVPVRILVDAPSPRCVFVVTGGWACVGALVPRDVPGRSAIAASFLGVGFSPASVRGGVGYMFRTGLALVDNLCELNIAKDGGCGNCDM